MPPRLSSSLCQQQQLLACLEAPLSSSLLGSRRPTIAAAAASLQQCFSHPTTTTTQKSSFSTSQPLERTRPQIRFHNWLKKSGKNHLRHDGDRPKYLYGERPDQPFPLNEHFISEPVLSDDARQRIWDAVMVDGLPLKAVSAQFSVDVRRIAAVLRLLKIQKRQEATGSPFIARPYAKTIMKMLPRAHLVRGEQPFEPINEIHVHSFTTQQIFEPVSETRQFTRADAAKAFGEHILPPDVKLRIPELIDLQKAIQKGVDPAQAEQDFIDKVADHERRFARRQQSLQRKEADNKIHFQAKRCEFRFEKINVDTVGKDGRARGGVGWRYGVPHNDRRRGLIKIPTSVE
ncbi:eukaryotic mitochondrial regulator protein-domain-containing protein [Podospora australis]|uniref:Eukaryotic mitochondrial regulator protein-domain-containing protein n=1 Tax=Podospora australis TaxID=1536484 RepID=A0AAN6WYU3_9PEZI|nr:eukaryotic mitochondrial regulator protein-domain-containing protein [Podospora australis]